jgi:hypothetical protein
VFLRCAGGTDFAVAMQNACPRPAYKDEEHRGSE